MMQETERNRRLPLGEERRQAILETLQREGKVLAGEISRALGVSDDTIRRDLDVMAEAGLLRRVHGGALRHVSVSEDYAARQRDAWAEKGAVARAAAALIRPGCIAILDAGTTAEMIARQLSPDLNATIVTNSAAVVMALASSPKISVIMLGGRLYAPSMGSVGATTVQAVQSVRADICLLSVLGLHPEAGVTDRDYEAACVKRAMMDVAADVVAVVTADRVGTVAPFVVGPLSGLTHIVTEASLPEDVLDPYRASGLTVVLG